MNKTHDEVKEEALKDPKVKREYDALEKEFKERRKAVISEQKDKLREKIEELLSQYSSELLAWKSWGINAVEKTHDLKVQIAGEIIALIEEAKKQGYKGAIQKVIDMPHATTHCDIIQALKKGGKQ